MTKFDACIISGELPVHGALISIDPILPRLKFLVQGIDIRYPPGETLAR